MRRNLAYAYALALSAALLVLAPLAVDRFQNDNPAPKSRFTPGDTVPITKEELCRGNASTPSIPPALERQVLSEYGISNPAPDAYEIDYLITPELGGATSLRNLWPQPYRNTTWNARVKDQLENRLHQMVCSGEIDLVTAQHELATDWISAYKKYFRTRKPLDGGPKARNHILLASR
jgi:hypothetical protein